MVFMAQGTPVEFILNYKYVAAELSTPWWVPSAW